MLSRFNFPVILILLGSFLITKKCEAQFEQNYVSTLTKYAIQFIVEYANWRRLDHIIIFDPVLNEGSITINLMQLLNCLGEQGIYSTMYSTTGRIFPETFQITRHRLGVVVLLACNESLTHRHVLYRASKNLLLDEQHSWLLITCGQDDTSIFSLLRPVKLALTTDLVIAVSQGDTVDVNTNNFDHKESSACPVSFAQKIYRTDSLDVQIHASTSRRKSSSAVSAQFDRQDLFQESLNKPVESSQDLNENITTDLTDSVPDTLFYQLIQIYKIRRDIEDSIVHKKLGYWGPRHQFNQITPFSPVEARQDLMGFPLIVGIRNWTSVIENEATRNEKGRPSTTDVDDSKYLMEIMEFIAQSLNATIRYVPFQSVGTEIKDGVWTDMLNAVVKGNVDIGLEKVTVTYHRLEQMAFTYNIMKRSHNLYMHPSELGVSKDIYLTPFSPRLLLCVLGMAVILAIVMLISSAVANYRARKNNTEIQSINPSYAALWIVGILSMQGSVWTPMTSSGNITLIASLIFALIIYNSYAAFITSILSVRTSDIKSLEDLYANGYKVGYIKNSLDEEHLQNREDNLKEIYLRGFKSTVSSIEEGLLLAARTKYAIFVSSQAARRVIQDLKPYESRCQIQEFVLKQTLDDVAFPLNKSSAYMKVINLGVLRLIESGTLSRILAHMLPDMPTCSADTSFVSAQLDDVLTAVRLLILGMILSIAIGIGECMIKNRKSLKYKFKLCCRKTCITVRDTVENFEF